MLTVSQVYESLSVFDAAVTPRLQKESKEELDVSGRCTLVHSHQGMSAAAFPRRHGFPVLALVWDLVLGVRVFKVA